MSSGEVKKSLLVIGNFLSRTLGVRSMAEELALRLSQRGWQVITASKRPQPWPRLFDMMVTAWQRRREYHTAYVEVYSGRAFFWAEAVSLTLRRAGKPYVLNLHGGALPGFARHWPGRVSRLLNSAVAVVTTSPYLLTEMSSYRKDLRLIPNGLSLQNYEFKLRAQPQPHLVWLRTFREFYNPSLAPKVLSRLSREFQASKLIMVGPDTHDGSLGQTQKTASDLNVAHIVSFPGKVPKEDVPVWLQKGDIFLNTTNVDNTPVSVIEAMALGLCLVSTEVGGIPYLLEHDTDALLVRPNDPDAMAAAVRRLLAEPGLARRLSENARKKAEQFDWITVLPQWESLLTAVAAGGKP
jgi:glycosyltransferase involved in cell wall biosynthesis